eukprot:CAMPEP_0178413950 /NCGR_PEP_ID=MMETSP0689_2-20121128/22788_1 /TAXON_ID=160604 /ORGANISM="Amphidinium massartii, Strain CS-259" /LENGTH=262 /DNA_ID=CAMNT_0020035231 /DNA_START=99 /DNA_END=887 /DNA_ORIENTATION=+
MAHVLCYGDSLTAGFCSGGLRFEPYSNALKAALEAHGCADARVSVCGLSGLTAKQMAADVDSDRVMDVCGHSGMGLRRMIADQGVPDIVLIMAGTNDIAYRRNAASILRDISYLHEICHEYGVPTIAMAPPSPLQHVRVRVSGLLRTWARASRDCVAFVDPEKDMVPRSTPGFWEPDCLHMSPLGYHVLGENIAPVVAEKVKKASSRGFSCELGLDRPSVLNLLRSLSGPRDTSGRSSSRLSAMGAKARSRTTGLLRKLQSW